ncbi:MAG: hypothetical protein WBA74_03640, partial [Cyclobacteriaceae bacterium]
MISGETESILQITKDEPFDLYDQFLGKKVAVKLQPTQEEIQARREKRNKFWSGVESRIKDSGGLEGITNSLGNAYANLKYPGRNSYNQGISTGQGFMDPRYREPGKNHTMTFLLVGTGVVVVG